MSRYSSALLDRVATARAASSEVAPAIQPAVERRLAPRLKALKEIVRERAEALGVPAPLLAQSRILESLVQASAAGRAELPEELRGWREALIGAPLLRALQAMDEET